MNGDTPAQALLAEASALVQRSDQGTSGLWPRAAVLLARQAIEVALATMWASKHLGVQDTSLRAQFLCAVPELGRSAAGQGYHTWSALSQAAHHHPYELAPTADEVRAWFEGAAAFIEASERVWRR